MLNKIKTMISVMGIKPNQEINTFKPNVIQEDQRDTQAVRRVAQHMADNHSLILARAFRPHSYDCKDNIMCEKDPCWVWQPDKIVGDPYVVGGSAATKFKVDDYDHQQDKPRKQIKKKRPIEKCKKGCQDKQYLQCVDCAMGNY